MKKSNFFKFALAGIGLAAFAHHSQAQDIVVDFSQDANGSSLSSGQIVSEGTMFDGISDIRVVNNGGGPDLGVIFDTNSVTGQDTDLGNPFLGTGNLPASTNFGNALIIQEDGYNRNGFISTDADDEAGGGYIKIDFEKNLVTSFALDLLDIDRGEASGFSLKIYGNGNQLLDTVTASDLQALDPNIVFGDHVANMTPYFAAADYGLTTLDRVKVTFSGSGAIDNLRLTTVPEPSSVALLGLASGVLFFRRRR